MALLKFFRIPKHQQFEYKTRYWDPRKEELEERLRKVEERKADGIEATKARIASGFRKKGYHGNKEYRRRQARRSNMILIGIVLVLLLLSYLFLTVYLPRIVQMIEHGGGQM
jgi:hypothetical protein